MRISDWSSDVCSSDLPSERLSFELNLNAWQNKSDPQAPQAIAIVQQNAAIPPDYPALNIAFAPPNGRPADWSPGIRPFANNKFRPAYLLSAWDVVDDITLTSLTSFVDCAHSPGIQGGDTRSVEKNFN